MSNGIAKPGPDRTALIVAALLFLIAGVVGYDANSLTLTSNYGIGPKAVPLVVCAALAILGLCHVYVAFKGGIPRPEAADPRAVLWLTGGLIGLIACIGFGGGFIVATAIVFAATARSFGREALLADFGIGLVLGLVIYLAFSKGLSLSLPQGPLEKLL